MERFAKSKSHGTSLSKRRNDYNQVKHNMRRIIGMKAVTMLNMVRAMETISKSPVKCNP